MAALGATDLHHRLRAAEAVVREAGRAAVDHFARRELLRIDRKGAQDLVSEADRACEDLIVAGLARLFPNDGFLGEERGAHNPDAAAVWVIDPIDGTHNFLTGIPFWCVSVGMVAKGELMLGIIHHPLAGELYSARRDGGAFLNGRARISVGFRSPIGTPANLTFPEQRQCLCSDLWWGSNWAPKHTRARVAPVMVFSWFPLARYSAGASAERPSLRLNG